MAAQESKNPALAAKQARLLAILAARKEHVITAETQLFGSAVVCETRYVDDIHAAVLQQGFCVACHVPPARH